MKLDEWYILLSGILIEGFLFARFIYYLDMLLIKIYLIDPSKRCKLIISAHLDAIHNIKLILTKDKCEQDVANLLPAVTT